MGRPRVQLTGTVTIERVPDDAVLPGKEALKPSIAFNGEPLERHLRGSGDASSVIGRAASIRTRHKPLTPDRFSNTQLRLLFDKFLRRINLGATTIDISNTRKMCELKNDPWPDHFFEEFILFAAARPDVNHLNVRVTNGKAMEFEIERYKNPNGSTGGLVGTHHGVVIHPSVIIDRVAAVVRMAEIRRGSIIVGPRLIRDQVVDNREFYENKGEWVKRD